MNNYIVSFQYSENVYCSNIAIAECKEDVEKHYSNYAWVKVSDASEYDLEEAKAKGKPIVTIEHQEPAVETKEEVIKAIEEYFNQNEETFTECIEELDSYNGYLGDDRYYDMDCLDDFYAESSPSELLQRVYYGHDDVYGDNSEFCPNRAYFYYNGYGNLVSADEKDYSAHLDHYAIEAMSDNRNWINTIEREPELSELFDRLENAVA